MDVLRRYAVIGSGLGSALAVCALLCGALGGRGSHTAAAAEPLAGPLEGPLADGLPEEPSALSPHDIEVILPPHHPQEVQVLTVQDVALPGRVGPSGSGAASPKSPAQLRGSAGTKAALSPPAVPAVRVKTVRMRVTAYCPCAICCGRATGITASGLRVSANGARFAATGDERLLPMGSTVSLPGYNGGRPVPVIDRMADEDEPRLDVYFRSHQRAQEWGVRWMDVTICVPVRAGQAAHRRG